MQCYDAPKSANSSGSNSYVYAGMGGTNNTVSITNNPTVLKSLLGSGTNMSADFPSQSASASGAAATSDVATVPGLSGAGPGTNGQRGSGDSGSGSSDSGPSGTAGGSGSAASGFVQGGGGSSSHSEAAPRQEKALQGSLFAVLVAVVGLLVL